jgi:hypothetical protein
MRNWNPKALGTSNTGSNPEAQQLASWFESFDIRHVLENLEDREISDQVTTAWQTTHGNIYDTLDYLKRNIPGWLSRFEKDPQAVTDTVKKIAAELEKKQRSID